MMLLYVHGPASFKTDQISDWFTTYTHYILYNYNDVYVYIIHVQITSFRYPHRHESIA